MMVDTNFKTLRNENQHKSELIKKCLINRAFHGPEKNYVKCNPYWNFPIINVDAKYKSVPWHKGTLIINIRSVHEWGFNISDSWLTGIKTSNNTLEVFYKENASPYIRDAVITFIVKGISPVYTMVYQSINTELHSLT